MCLFNEGRVCSRSRPQCSATVHQGDFPNHFPHPYASASHAHPLLLWPSCRAQAVLPFSAPPWPPPTPLRAVVSLLVVVPSPPVVAPRRALPGQRNERRCTEHARQRRGMLGAVGVGSKEWVYSDSLGLLRVRGLPPACLAARVGCRLRWDPRLGSGCVGGVGGCGTLGGG